MPTITPQDLEDLAVGSAILGTGGGGDPYIGKLMAAAAIARHGPVELVPIDAVDPDWHVVSAGAMGAPTIIIEKIASGAEIGQALAAYEAFTGRRADAIIAVEAGGINSMMPVVLAAERRLPMIDGDGMGRAFPQLEMETYNVYGVPACPLAMADERGNEVVIETPSAAKAEWLARGVTIRMGGQSYLAQYGMSGADARRTAVPGTMSLAIGIGRTLREAKARHHPALDALIAFFAGTHYGHARVLASGKVSDVERRVANGWSVGIATVEPFAGGAPIRVTIQNENLVAEQDGAVLAIVPDLITLLDVDTAEAITTERLRYGQRVDILGVRVPEIMRTPEALAVFGPKAFGLDRPYVPLAA